MALEEKISNLEYLISSTTGLSFGLFERIGYNYLSQKYGLEISEPYQILLTSTFVIYGIEKGKELINYLKK